MVCSKSAEVTLVLFLSLLPLPFTVFSANGDPYDYPTIKQENAKAVSSYEAMLKVGCPRKHLQVLNPGLLAGALADFSNQLSFEQNAQVEKVAKIETMCADVIIGASCSNLANIRALWKLGLLSKFAKTVCEMPIACGTTHGEYGDFDDCGPNFVHASKSN